MIVNSNARLIWHKQRLLAHKPIIVHSIAMIIDNNARLTHKDAMIIQHKQRLVIQ